MITCRHRRRRTLILTRCSSVRHFEYFNQNRPPDKPSLARLLPDFPLPPRALCAHAPVLCLSPSFAALRRRCAGAPPPTLLQRRPLCGPELRRVGLGGSSGYGRRFFPAVANEKASARWGWGGGGEVCALCQLIPKNQECAIRFLRRVAHLSVCARFAPVGLWDSPPRLVPYFGNL